MSERSQSDAEPAAPDAEVSRLSLWFLRSVLFFATAVVLAFAVQAIVSLLDDDTLADLPATTTPTDLGIDEAVDPVEAAASETSADEQAELDAFVDEAIVFIEEARRRNAPALRPAHRRSSGFSSASIRRTGPRVSIRSRRCASATSSSTRCTRGRASPRTSCASPRPPSHGSNP
mgnify:CR=1 FL=1